MFCDYKALGKWDIAATNCGLMGHSASVFPKSLFHPKCWFHILKGTPVACADFGVHIFFHASALTLCSAAGVGADFLFASRILVCTTQGNVHDFKQLQDETFKTKRHHRCVVTMTSCSYYVAIKTPTFPMPCPSSFVIPWTENLLTLVRLKIHTGFPELIGNNQPRRKVSKRNLVQRKGEGRFIVPLALRISLRYGRPCGKI